MENKPTLTYVPIEKLIMLRRNPQYLTPKQMNSLGESIRRDGFVVPCLVRPITGGLYEIVSGNHRFLAAKEAGLEEIPCVILEMCEQAAKRMALNLNTIHGEPSAELMAPFLSELDDETLSKIYLEDSALKDIMEFSEDLKSKLESMQIPSSFGAESPLSEIGSCVCPLCKKRHIKKGAEDAPAI